MTLAKQTTLMMIVALTTIFICTFIITVYHSKTYFEEQLQHNTQDTATALGLSMSKMANKKMDTVTMLQMISAVFDRGYFSGIYVRNNEGAILVKRYLKAKQTDVPNWFTRLMHITNEEQASLVMRGWQQIGEVVVQSDTAVVYMALWHTTTKLFFLFFITTLLTIGISVLLIKAIFKPLKLIIKQAEDISKKNLYILEKRPRVKELQQLSTTMNAMVIKLKEFFSIQIEETERLRAKAYQDSLTGKGNRRYFFQQFNQYISREEHFLPGFLFLIELEGLAPYNQRFGYQEGDQVIVGITHCLDALFLNQPPFLLARLDGPSFAAVILEQERPQIESLGHDIAKALGDFLSQKEGRLSCSIGIVQCRFADPVSNMLAKADNIIKTVQDKEGTNYGIEPEAINVALKSNEKMRAIIVDAIQNKNFNFYCQPVKSVETVYHRECFIKLLNNGHEIAAGLFFPIVEQFALGGDIDQLVFQEIVKIKEKTTLAINLSTCTVSDEKTQRQFLMLVKEWTNRMSIKIHFELSEFNLVGHEKSARRLMEALIDLGHSVGLDRVGVILAPLAYLKELNLTYLKLDGSLSKGLEKNKLNQDVILSWLTTAERLDMLLIATTIESEHQWRILTELGVTYFQGNYIQSPLRLLMD